jgi:tryptophan synthase alpha chain
MLAWKPHPLIIGPDMQNPIRQRLEEFKREGRLALVPFVPAGYPDLETTRRVLEVCDRAGACVIEVGFPFSDPIADGPVIQEAFTAALAKKLKTADVLRSVQEVSGKLSAPLVAMVSYSIVFRYGLARFLADAKGAGFAGLILPDLPPPEAEEVCRQVHAAGLETILLIAPTSTPVRRAEITRLCTGFVYYLSVSGITGERDRLPSGLVEAVGEIKKITDVPVCVGFGLHKRQQIEDLAKFADGAIVGSAIVRRMKEHSKERPEGIADAVGEYLRELIGPPEGQKGSRV